MRFSFIAKSDSHARGTTGSHEPFDYTNAFKEGTIYPIALLAFGFQANSKRIDFIVHYKFLQEIRLRENGQKTEAHSAVEVKSQTVRLRLLQHQQHVVGQPYRNNVVWSWNEVVFSYNGP